MITLSRKLDVAKILSRKLQSSESLSPKIPKCPENGDVKVWGSVLCSSRVEPGSYVPSKRNMT